MTCVLLQKSRNLCLGGGEGGGALCTWQTLLFVVRLFVLPIGIWNRNTVFSKYWSKTTRKNNLQNKGNITNWGLEFVVIYRTEILIVFCLSIYEILLTYFFCFSYFNWYNRPIFLTLVSLFVMFDIWSKSKFPQQKLNILGMYYFLFQV